MSALAFLSITASTACTACKQPLPLNGATESVLCDGCRTAVPTSALFWKEVLGDALDGLPSLKDGEAQRSTMMLAKIGMTIEVETARLAARCEACKTPLPVERIGPLLATPSGGDVPCASCAASLRVRPAPPWFRAVDETVVGFVGETVAGAARQVVDPRTVRFHCYHCGGNLPLDGKVRAVACPYCSAHVTVPDDIWVRLHPVATRQRWFAVVGGASAAPGLPADAWSFCDLEVGPDGGVIVAFHASDDGDAGHPSRIMRVGPEGARIWEQDGVPFSDSARLGLSPGDARLVVREPDEDWLRFLDAQTGQPVGTLKATKNARGGDGFSIRDADSVVVDWDGTILVDRRWNDDDDTSGRALRRFARDGSRLPTWPGLKIKDRHDDAPPWTALRHKPEHLPDACILSIGWDGFVYVVCERLTHVAKLARDGSLVGLVAVQGPARHVAGTLLGFGVARDGTMLALAEHPNELGDRRYPHVLRIFPNGALEPIFGPHAPSPTFIGRYTNRMRLYPDGRLYLAYGLDSLRVVAPNGAITWRSRATVRRDEEDLEELAKDRRGKRLVADARAGSP